MASEIIPCEQPLRVNRISYHLKILGRKFQHFILKVSVKICSGGETATAICLLQLVGCAGLVLLLQAHHVNTYICVFQILYLKLDLLD